MKIDAIILLIYLILFLLLIKFSPFILGAIIIGFYFSIIIDVPADFLSKKINKKISKIISYSIILGLLVYSITKFFPIVITQGKNIFNNLSQLSITNNDKIPNWVSEFLNNSNKQLSNFALDIINKILSYTPSFITMAILIIITTIAVGNLKWYVAKNAESLFIDDPKKGKNFLKSFYTDFEKFVKGQVLVAAFVGLIVGFLSFAFKIEGAFFLGSLSFITDFIPFLGVIIVTIPMLMLGWTSKGLTGLIIGLVILIIANQLESWVLAPKIQSSNLKIHWFILIVSILIFADLFGFIGILIAIPTLLFVKRYWKEYILGGKYDSR
ncbi:AI-2E family transporter [Thermosipho atlanticus]|uniref:Predicted PurR-regulated permease PerM n=1 Tax=Thermosipho atlanticus DSM 15807 TaxID=1123380 RepID=A0A1M5R3A8_9BACT|nr:AI-2E family transporter [Thermosipho atlanticus]SHH20681.1 Predicted PurR-regulated permease PerM [Thermosipho atlanticus DSM 15807]